MPVTRRRKAAPEPVVEEDAFEDLDDLDDEGTEDLEELEDEPEEEPAPKRRTRKTAAAPAASNGKSASDDASPYNTAWLAEHVAEMTGEAMDSRSLRILLRKMANDGTLAREVGTDRSRYTFPRGENDPVVKAVIKRINAGELKAAKREKLEEVKKTAPAKKTIRKAAAAEPVEEETSAPRSRSRRAATKAAPAKVAPASGRRRRAAAE